MEYINNYFIALWELTTDMAPYLLLGFLFAGLLKVFLPANIMNKYLGNSSFKSVVNASILGVPLPLCSCGVLPAGISLYKNGASKGSSVSFLISTPQTGVDSILVTWSMLGLPLAIIRPIAAFVTGISGGVIANKFDTKAEREAEAEKRKKTNTVKPKKTLGTVLHYAFVEMVMDIAKWLIIGLLIAALISVLVPDNFFTDFHLDGILGMLVMLVVSIPLYVCATSSVPIAAVLLLKGISPGALLVFLMAGPATNAATITVVGKNLGRKTLIVYLSTIIVGSLLFGFIIDTFLPGAWFFPLSSMGTHEHGLLPHWFNVLSSVALIAFLLNVYITKIMDWFKKKKRKTENESGLSLNIPSMTIGVEGMTCEMCKAKVEKGLGSMDNIKYAVANPQTNKVEIYGDDTKIDSIKKKIEDLGYNFTGIDEK
ncbi:MAG: heavy metal-associated domain-containing protein [Marinilabiliales bacterium]|nr:MAG: heavy metal-associated domain-containing protein [Marinilabiliales bacterium]